jgi:hypothetical protein
MNMLQYWNITAVMVSTTFLLAMNLLRGIDAKGAADFCPENRVPTLPGHALGLIPSQR